MMGLTPPTDEKLESCPLWRRGPVFRLLIIALLAEIGYAVLNISTMPVYLVQDRKFTEGVMSVVIVAFLLSEAVFKGWMGHLADRYGRRRLMVIGPSLTVFTSIMTMVVPHGWGYSETFSLMILRIMDGIGAAMLWPAAFALMGDMVQDNERQESMSLLNTCYLIGIALALPVGGIFNDVFGPYLAGLTGARTPSLYLAAILFLTVSITAYRSVPSSGKQRTVHEEHVEIQGFLTAVRQIPQFVLMGLITFCGIGFPMVIIKLFAADQLHMSESEFGLMALPGALAMAALSVPMSRFGERVGRARAVHIGLGLCALGLVFIASGAFLEVMRSRMVLALGGIPLGIGFLLAIPAWYASVSELDPNRRAANIGAVMTAQGLGAIIGAPLGGWSYGYFQRVSTDFGHYSPFIGCAACVTIAWLVSMRIIRAESAQSK
jgi:DHA1 family multidrug resistance protein-like MFS transporter